ncbi:MAG: hypothetical protein GX418_06835, partial [Clostridiales bacterium]|nr:hypothetical protein [Clostridiales bacterium]
AAFGQEAQAASLRGLITEVGDGFFLMEDETVGDVRVNLRDGVTVYDGIAARDAMAVGQYVFVTHTGAMTRSIPPQVTALKVGCYVVSGTAEEILLTGVLVGGDAVLGEVIVRVDDQMPTVHRNVPITVYYNGVMTLSLPPQISAAYLTVPVLEGTVSALDWGGFTMTEANGDVDTVMVTSETLMRVLPAVGDTVVVYYDGTLLDVRCAYALEVAPLTAADGEALYTHE